MNKLLISIVVTGLALGMVLFFLTSTRTHAPVPQSDVGESVPPPLSEGVVVEDPPADDVDESISPPPPAATPPQGAASPSVPSVKSFVVEGNNFSFSVSEMRVRAGDTVRVTFKNVEGLHDWRVDEFNAGTEVIPTDQEQTIEFIADKTGSFEYYCSVGNHRARGMIGTLIVE
jgi:nitrite reductase (NO-forming)